MIPKRVVLENFLSFGSPKTEIEFTNDEPLWVLAGANGVGKSAVFDAMTFALFGQHRGGGQNADLLVKHGANGFSVTFEFEFDGSDYRITRNRKGKSSTHSVERKNPDSGKWERVPNVNSVSDVKGWSERTLGLGFDAFKASVLLRQGEADAIITAGGTERLKILKKIIGAERYEELSARVHLAARERKQTFDDLSQKRDVAKPVSEADIDAANAAVATAAQAKLNAARAATEALQCVNFSKQWVKHDADHKALCGQIREADDRALDRERIRRDKARLDDLAAAVPVLVKFVAVRDRIAEAEPALAAEREAIAKLQEEVAKLSEAVAEANTRATGHGQAAAAHKQDAERLREEAVRDAKFLAAADRAAALEAQVKEFAKDLDEKLAAALERVREAVEAVTDHEKEKAEAAGLLKQAKTQQQKFATVCIDVPCSLCGQPVTEKHARDERKRLADAVTEYDTRVRNADREKTDAERKKAEAERERDQFDRQVRDRNSKVKQLADQQTTLRDLGVTADPAELSDLLTRKEGNAQRLETAAKEELAKRDTAVKDAARDESQRELKAAEVGKAETRAKECEQKLNVDRGQRSTLLDQLSPTWQSRAGSIDKREVESLDDERRRLAGSGVAAQFQQLEQDAARREEWVKQRDALARQIEDIPQPARVPAATAEADERAARREAGEADAAWTVARDAAADFARRAADYRKLGEDIAKAERQHDLYRKLDELLGKGGLQRELVRGAEREIVRIANDTVQNLSSGDLNVELDDAADGDDEAFALRVRKSDDPLPIGVDYLSGSQKFRVAVAVALAIGRFAAGQARPLECVIIDEGFGSLDRDGLRAARDELNRLRQFLRRIILVSHQEEFAREFPVVIQLSRGPDGTIVERFRREGGAVV